MAFDDTETEFLAAIGCVVAFWLPATWFVYYLFGGWWFLTLIIPAVAFLVRVIWFRWKIYQVSSRSRGP